ncbi:MAG: hypothetical protein JWO67_2631 [Streptosporangiaceae bacterium]|nr:hypothetical protein [Streptosporangiaceae bacterium]
MIPNSRRVAALALAGAFTLAPAVSGCGAGMRPQTASPAQLTEGVNASTDSGVDVRNLFVLGPAPGEKLMPGTSAAVYASVTNDGRDRKADRLVAVESPTFQQKAKLPGGGLDLPAGQLVQIGTKTATAQDVKTTPQPSGKGKHATHTPAVQRSGGPAGTPAVTPDGLPGAQSGTQSPDQQGTGTGPKPRPAVVLTGLTKELLVGESIELTLRFQRGGSITVLAPVVPRAEPYATYAAPSTPSPAGSATSSSSAGAAPSGSAAPASSGSPSASPSPAASKSPGGSASPAPGAHG